MMEVSASAEIQNPAYRFAFFFIIRDPHAMQSNQFPDLREFVFSGENTPIRCGKSLIPFVIFMLIQLHLSHDEFNAFSFPGFSVRRTCLIAGSL
jgi:hypothetical protein